MNHPHHLNFWPDYAVAGSLTAYVTAVLSVLAAWATGLFGIYRAKTFNSGSPLGTPRPHHAPAFWLGCFIIFGSLPFCSVWPHSSHIPAGRWTLLLSRQCLSFSRNAHHFRHCSCFHDRLYGYKCSVGTRYILGHNLLVRLPSSKKKEHYFVTVSTSYWSQLVASASPCLVNSYGTFGYCTFNSTFRSVCARCIRYLYTQSQPSKLYFNDGIWISCMVCHLWN